MLILSLVILLAGLLLPLHNHLIILKLCIKLKIIIYPLSDKYINKLEFKDFIKELQLCIYVVVSLLHFNSNHFKDH
jgi:hypothetical protein